MIFWNLHGLNIVQVITETINNLFKELPKKSNVNLNAPEKEIDLNG